MLCSVELRKFVGAVMFCMSFFDKAECKYRPKYRQNQDTMLWLDGMKAGTKHANLPNVVLRFRFTNSLFKKRRNGWALAKKQLHDCKKNQQNSWIWLRSNCIWIYDVLHVGIASVG